MLGALQRSLGVFFFSAIVISSAFAQAPSKKLLLRGRILDTNRAVIANADIWASGEGHSPASTATNWAGEFSLALEPGEYSLRVMADGFAEANQKVSLADTSPSQ